MTRTVLEAARVLVENSGLRGVFGIDFILRQGHAWFLEVNPRVTASHMLYELQQPGVITQRHIAALGWKSVRPRRSLEKPASCRLLELSPVAARMILWAQDDIRVPEGFGIASPSTVKISDRPRPGTLVPGASPLCSIQLIANHCDEIVQQLYALGGKSGTHPDSTFSTLQMLGYSTHSIAAQLKLLCQKYRASTTRS